MKTNIWYLIKNIFTLGIYGLVINKKAKKIVVAPKSDLTQSKIIDINIEKFIDFLGGKNNITGVDATLSTLIVKLKDKVSFDESKYPEFKIHGLVKSDKKITIVFGDNATAIKEKIKEYINI